MSGYIIRSFGCMQVPEAYVGLIFAKWLHSLRYGNDFFRMMDQESYYHNYRKHIARILAAPDCVVHIAVLNDDHDVALGFSVCRGDALDYVHVHKDHRRQGIMTRLIPAHIARVTHMTRAALHIWGTKKHGLKFDPFA